MEKLDSTENLYALHEGKPNKNVLNQNDSSLNQYCDATKSENYFTTVKVTLPLYCSGLLNPRRKYLTPVLALRGLRIQIELNNFLDMFQATQAPLYEYLSNQAITNQLNGNYGGYTASEAYRVQATANVGANQITLMKYGDFTIANEQAVLSDDRANPAHLFCVGQKIKVEGNANEFTVSAVTVNGDNRLVLTLSNVLLSSKLISANRLLGSIITSLIPPGTVTVATYSGANFPQPVHFGSTVASVCFTNQVLGM